MKRLQRKGITFLLSALILALSIFPGTALAAGDSLSIKGESAILIDADTGRILYEKT